MDFGQKIFREIDLFDFARFFVYTFLNFMARCDVIWREKKPRKNIYFCIFLGKREIFRWFKAKLENIYHQKLTQLFLMEKQFLDPKLLVDHVHPNGIFTNA